MNVITLGTFDILHYGHIRLLKRLDNFPADKYVGLNTDEFVKKYRGKPPVMSYEERKQSILEVFPDYTVIPNNQSDGTIKKVLDKVKPRIIIIGSDWLARDYLKQIGLTTHDLYLRDIDIFVVPYTESISSTEIKKRICSQ